MTQEKTTYADLLGIDRQVIGLARKDIEHDISKRFRGLGNYTVPDGQVVHRERDTGIVFKSLVGKHLGVDYQSVEEIAQLLVAGIEISVDYFYGDYLLDPKWAEQMSKQPDNEYLSWLEVFQNGSLFCLLGNDDENLRRLAQWVEPSLPPNETPYLYSVQDNSYQKLLAEFLATGTTTSKQLRSDVENSRKRRPKLLLSCLDAIEAKDEMQFSKHFKSYLNHFLKSEFYDGGLPCYASIQGTILWHVAARNGINVSDLSEKQHATIITRESLGIE
jgi:hypothetical protein